MHALRNVDTTRRSIQSRLARASTPRPRRARVRPPPLVGPQDLPQRTRARPRRTLPCALLVSAVIAIIAFAAT